VTHRAVRLVISDIYDPATTPSIAHTFGTTETRKLDGEVVILVAEIVLRLVSFYIEVVAIQVKAIASDNHSFPSSSLLCYLSMGAKKLGKFLGGFVAVVGARVDIQRPLMFAHADTYFYMSEPTTFSDPLSCGSFAEVTLDSCHLFSPL